MIVRLRRSSRSQMGPVPLDSGQEFKRSVSANNSVRLQDFPKISYNTPVMMVKPLQAVPRRLSHSLDSGLVSLPSPHQTDSTVCSTSSTPTTSQAVQVHEFLFLGNTDISRNTRYILQNNIHYFVNVSVTTNTSRSSRFCQTNVRQTTNALQSKMVVSYRDNMPLKDLFESFQAVNDMISLARNKAKRVLIYSNDNLAVCQAFAISYNVQYYDMSLDRVVESFQRLKIDVKLNNYLRTALMRWAAWCKSNRKGALKDSGVLAHLGEPNCNDSNDHQDAKTPQTLAPIKQKRVINYFIGGITADEFAEVKEIFRCNFTSRSEREGASLAVYHNGKLVVNLWGGFADREMDKPWKEDTITNIFGCTKSVAAVCMAMKVDQGECNYEDKVTKFWPEFGQNDKEEITIDMILTHRAGLPYFDAEFDLNGLTHEKISKIIEAEMPKYPPGTKIEYHAITFGWLIDQVFRRIDRNHRTIGEFYRDEVQKKYGTDVYIGSCAEQESRIAKLPTSKKNMLRREPTNERKILALSRYFNFVKVPKGNKESTVNDDFHRVDMFNDPRIRAIGQPAVNGVASARGLVQTFQLLLDGTLISNNMLKRLSRPQYENEFDRTIGKDECKGYGFIYDKSPSGSWQIGHRALGGQTIRMDPENNLVICYLSNSLKNWIDANDPKTYDDLQTAIYSIVMKKKEEKKP